MEKEVTLEDVYEAVRILIKQVDAIADRIYDLTEKVDAGKREKHTHHHYPKRDTYSVPPSDWH